MSRACKFLVLPAASVSYLGQRAYIPVYFCTHVPWYVRVTGRRTGSSENYASVLRALLLLLLANFWNGRAENM